MLKCATSLWSADLANLAADIQRVAPYSERFHLDVVDGHYAPTMLFFPDLVAALQPHTPYVHIATLNDSNDSSGGSSCSTILRLSASICGLSRE